MIQKSLLIEQQLKALGIDTQLVMIKLFHQRKGLCMVKFINSKFLNTIIN